MEHSAISPKDMEARLYDIREELRGLSRAQDLPPGIKQAVTEAADRAELARFAAEVYQMSDQDHWEKLAHD